MSNAKYTLEDFAAEVDVNHPLAARRIPVIRTSHPRWRYHVALVVGGPEYLPETEHGLEPTPAEVEQVAAYLEKTMRYYNATYRARVEAKGPFDVDGTVNTAILRKHPTHGWQYRMTSWTSGPLFAGSSDGSPMTLEQLLDRMCTYGDGGPIQSWLDVKADSGAFASESA